MIKASEILGYIALAYSGDWDRMYECIKKRWKFDVPTALEELSKLSDDYVTLVDSKFPETLKNLRRPPFTLFYRGNYELLRHPEKTVTIVGSRECGEYGRQMTRKIVSELCEKGYIIVSGLAKGIDTAALEEAVKYGRGIAVLGTGLDVAYPAENSILQQQIAQNGLLLTEYPPGIGPKAAHFPMRNRILAGLSKMTVLTEAKRRSGSLITANYAIENGSDVGCLPYRADEDSLCNELIKDGAVLVESAADVIETIRRGQGVKGENSNEEEEGESGESGQSEGEK